MTDLVAMNCESGSDFSCAYLKSVLLHGRMYISHNFVCFYSNVFGFENKVHLLRRTRWTTTSDQFLFLPC
jgi:hypothetical protein